MFGIGQVAEAMRLVRRVTEAAIANATSVCRQVESRIAMLAENAEGTTSCAVGEIS